MPKIQNLRHKYQSCKGIILLDNNLVIIFINTIALKILKLDKHKVLGTNILLHLPCPIRQSILPKLNHILNIKHKTNHDNLKLTTQMEASHYSDFRMTLKSIFKINNSSLKGISINMIWIIENNKIQDLTHQHISNLSHELRAPLFNIRSFLETLYEYNNQLTVEQRLEFLEIATNETNRLNNLVRNILDFAELDNQDNYELSQSSLTNIVQEILQLSKITAINKRLLLFKTINGMEEVVVSDYSSLTRVLSNLLNNSIKFTYPKGVINIHTKKLQSKFFKIKYQRSVGRISIIDTGIGVSKIDNKKIFNRFARGNKKTHTITGSGLGLHIVNETLGKKRKKLSFYSNTKKGSSASFNVNIIK
nr:two-component sensor kinase [Rhodomonas sp. NIES-2332]